jgi:hypothetical protein
MSEMTNILLGSQEPNPYLTVSPPGARVWRDWFAYQVPVFSNLAANGGTATNQIVIQNDSDFEWVAGSLAFDQAAAAYTYQNTPIPNMSVLIVDGGSGRQLMNAPVPVISVFGLPGKPKMLPISKVFGRTAVVQFTVTNYDAAVANGNLRLTLHGWKIFYGNP